MNTPQAMPPRKSVPAPRPSAAARLRERIFSPNAIRTVSVAVFFAIWEYYGRRMDPIFMAPPSAIFNAALELLQSGALRKAIVESLWPFAVGMALTVMGKIATETRMVTLPANSSPAHRMIKGTSAMRGMA